MLSPEHTPSADLMLGIQWLLRAFAPELAGMSLEQVRYDAGIFKVCKRNVL